MSGSVRIPEAQRELAAQIALVGKIELASALGVSIWTVDRWRQKGNFPKPIRLTDRSPWMWRVRDIDAWITKRQAARIRPEPYRGAVRAQMEGRRRSE